MKNNSSEITKMNTWCSMNNMMCMCMRLTFQKEVVV